MVSVSCLMAFVACCGSDVGYFGLDLVMGGIFGIACCNSIWPML